MPRKPYRPPFEITPKAFTTCAEIMRLVGRYEGLLASKPQPKLRRQNRIRTIVGSLAIEGNTLSSDKVSAILEHKRVLGPRREIMEVENANEAYERAPRFHPAKPQQLLAAHRIMMNGLIEDAGRFRSKSVGVVQGSRVAHVAPPAQRVPDLVSDVLSFLARENSVLPLVKSAVVHYELEFIHPFSDGNGRMGRLWQHVILVRFHPLFEFLPIESVIHSKQHEYYRVLGLCDRAGNSSLFIEFCMAAVHESLQAFLAEIRPEPITADTRLEFARQAFGRQEFSRKVYLSRFPALSTATASRDLRHAVDRGLLEKIGDRALARYRFR